MGEGERVTLFGQAVLDVAGTLRGGVSASLKESFVYTVLPFRRQPSQRFESNCTTFQ